MKKTPENGKISHALGVGRNNIVKMAIIPNVMYRFNAMPTKVSEKILHRPQKNNTQLHMEKEKPRRAKMILYDKRASGGITIPNFKIYYRATVMKTAWY